MSAALALDVVLPRSARCGPRLASRKFSTAHLLASVIGDAEPANDLEENVVGARGRASESCHWTSKDPIRFSGGLNVYAYVSNQPINLVDPLGLEGMDGNPTDAYLFDNTEWHRCRNRRNRCPKRSPPVCQTEKDKGWEFGPNVSPKWRSPEGYECLYDEKGDLLPDRDANYTFNYGPKPWSLRHIVYDWIAHHLYRGNGAYEPGLTKETECE